MPARFHDRGGRGMRKAGVSDLRLRSRVEDGKAFVEIDIRTPEGWRMAAANGAVGSRSIWDPTREVHALSAAFDGVAAAFTACRCAGEDRCELTGAVDGHRLRLTLEIVGDGAVRLRVRSALASLPHPYTGRRTLLVRFAPPHEPVRLAVNDEPARTLSADDLARGVTVSVPD